MVKAEGSSAAGLRLQQVCEACFRPRALILKRQRAAWGWKVVRNAFAVFGGLQFNPGQGVPLLLGLHHSNRGTIHKQEIVSFAVACLQRELANSDTAPCGQVRLPLVLLIERCLAKDRDEL